MVIIFIMENPLAVISLIINMIKMEWLELHFLLKLSWAQFTGMGKRTDLTFF